MRPTPVHSRSQLRRTLVQQHKCHLVTVLVCALFAISCSTTRKTFDPNKKFSGAQLQQDYQLLQKILEQKHPGLYWYSTPLQMDSAFNAGRMLLKDSMTEYEFRKVLSLVISKIQCGHTSVRASKSYQKYFDTLRSKRSFPLNVKAWNDTLVLVAPVKNTPLVRGDIIDSINGRSAKHIFDTLLRFIPADGDNRVAKSQLLSGASYFASLYSGVFGWPKTFRIAYRDSLNQPQQASIKPVTISQDSLSKSGKKASLSKTRKSKTEKLKEQRSLELRSDKGYAVMELNSFSGSPGLKRFIRRSFQTLADSSIGSLIIDLRLNGGGRISNSTYLTRYLARQPFKTGDSIYAKKPVFQYSRFMKKGFTTTVLVSLLTKRVQDKYHLNHFEKKYYQPIVKNHYKGHIYVLTGGYTYSASVLVLQAVRGQSNVTIVGEPSGGAAYGNTAMMIPDVTLPQTGVRFRLPLFRLVIDRSQPQNGLGVLPDVYVGTTPGAIRKGTDVKMEKALDLISTSNGSPDKD